MVAAFSVAAWDGSPFELEVCAPLVSLFAVLVLPGLAITLWLCHVQPRVNYGVALTLALALSVYLFLSGGTRVRSDPEHDFVRFVLNGPHWQDEDQNTGYNVAMQHLPAGVQVLRSRTFRSYEGSGCVLYFAANPGVLADLIKLNALAPTSNPIALQRLDAESAWFLHVRAEDLATPPVILARAPVTGVENWLLATNAARDRAIFVYLDAN